MRYLILLLLFNCALIPTAKYSVNTCFDLPGLKIQIVDKDSHDYFFLAKTPVGIIPESSNKVVFEAEMESLGLVGYKCDWGFE